MIAIVFSALGTAFGSVLKDMRGFQIIMNFLVLPIFFLSGALYPLSNLPKVMTVITRLDPLAYGVDGLRGTLINHWQFTPALDLAVLRRLLSSFFVEGRGFSLRLKLRGGKDKK